LLAAGYRALDVHGDLRESRRWFDLAYGAAASPGDPYAMAEAAVGLSGLWVHEHRTTGACAALEMRLRHALSLVEFRSPLGIRLRARLAGEADYRTGGHATIMAVVKEARQSADPLALAEALRLAHHCLLGPGHGAVRRRLAQELVDVGVLTGHRSDVLAGVLWQVVGLFLDGDPHARRRLAELHAMIGRRDHLAVGFVASAIEVMLAIRAGRLDDAEALAQGCAERGTAAGDVDAAGWHGGQLVAIRWYQGRLVELLPLLRELAHSPTLSAVDNSHFAALAVAAAQAGHVREAAGALARLRGRGLANLPRSSSWLVTMYGVVEAAHLLDDADTSAQAYELLQPFACLPAVASLGVACFGSVQHALGVASLSTGHTDRAIEHLREAIEGNLALDHRPAVAASRRRYAQALAMHTDPGAGDSLSAAPGRGGIVTPGPAATCVREGQDWRLRLGSHNVLVPHSVGMQYLTVLVANPRQEVPSVDLVAGVNRVAPPSPQPMLDRVAILEYRQRVSRLRVDIHGWETAGSSARAAEARAERDWLLAQLSAATGIGGRTRRFPDGSERARVSVGKAIRRAVVRIVDADPTIGEHIRRTVRTGVRCSYRPDPG
jgi:hypothetical protein